MNYLKNKISGQKGFTLAEVLIVLSIIVTMATFAITRLNPIRSRSKDTSIKVSLATLRNTAEINFNSQTGYASICNNLNQLSLTDPEIKSINDKIGKEVGSAAGVPATGLKCYADTSSYFVYVPLVAASSNVFCIDSNGFSEELATTSMPATPATPFKCQ